MKADMKAYPTLARMGVESPKQIKNYYVTSINYVDVLRILYDRPEASFLTSSRVYKFPRVQQEVADGGNARTGTPVLQLHPMLKEATAELKNILEKKAAKHDITAEILEEIELLEEDIALRSETLKALVQKIPEIC